MKSWSPSITSVGFVKGDSIFDGSYSVDAEGICHFQARYSFGSTVGFVEGNAATLSLPVPPHPSAIGAFAGVVRIVGSSLMYVALTSAGYSVTTTNLVGTVDFFVAAGNVMVVTGSYRAA